MKIVEGAGAHFITKSPCFVAFGAFDGIHKGHQALFEQLQHEAKLHGAQSCVFTFSNHPLEVIKPDTANYRLTVKEQKISLLRKMGLDIAVIVEFTKDFAEMSAEEFIGYLVRMCPLHTILVGHDVAFGKNRSGDQEMLVALSRKFGFSVQFMKPVTLGGQRISSTQIRKLLKDGDVDKVEPLLGRRYSIFGPISTGIGAAKDMACPTFNMRLDHRAYPKEGIYAVRVRFNEDDVWLKACAYIGRAKTLHPRLEPQLEVHLLEADPVKMDQMRGSSMEVEFHAFLREDMVFASKRELLDQIQKDVSQAHEVFR